MADHTDPGNLPQATVVPRRRTRISVVWIIPVLAAVVALGIAIQRILSEGPTITIVFKAAAGIEAGKTFVKYKDVNIGQVTAVQLAAAVGQPIAVNYPVSGRDAFRTGTGVHAAAIIKARAKGHDWLADRVYSGVPASLFGQSQRISVGYMSGKSNAAFWLAEETFRSESFGTFSADPRTFWYEA